MLVAGVASILRAAFGDANVIEIPVTQAQAADAQHWCGRVWRRSSME